MRSAAPNVPKCQIGFINFVVAPLYDCVSELLDIPLLISHLKSNLELNEREAEEAVRKSEHPTAGHI